MKTYVLLNIFNIGRMHSGEIIELLISILVILFSLSFHEYAHGWMANRLGDSTAKDAGRLTLNPLAHLDPIGTIMMLSGIIGWAKPVPINPYRFRQDISMKKGIVLTSLAGPVSNLILSFISQVILLILTVLLVLLGYNGNFTSNALHTPITILIMIFQKGVILNIFLAVFNILPVPPLDGYKIFGAFLPSDLYYKIMRYESYIGMAFLAVIFLAPSVLDRIMHTLAYPFIYIIQVPMTQLAQLLIGLFIH